MAWSESTSVLETLAKPTPFSWASASANDLPTTPGTFWVASLATVIVTSVSFSAFEPPCGSCEMTVSGDLSDSAVLTFTVKPLSSRALRALSADSSTTSGTSTLGAPVETTTVTVSPASICASEPGVWLQILSFSWVSHGSLEPTFRVTSALSASLCASWTVEPTMFGTSTLSPPLSLELKM